MFLSFKFLDFTKAEKNFKKLIKSLPPKLQYEVVYKYDQEDFKKGKDLNNNTRFMSSFNLNGNSNFSMHDASKKSFESGEKQLLLKNVTSTKTANDIERYAFMLTKMFPTSTIKKAEGIWLITFSSNLSNKRF